MIRMTCKYVEVKTLSNTEESMRWYLQEKHNHAQKYRDADVLTEWNEAMLFADFLVAPKKWAVRAGVVILMEEV